MHEEWEIRLGGDWGTTQFTHTSIYPTLLYSPYAKESTLTCPINGSYQKPYQHLMLVPSHHTIPSPPPAAPPPLPPILFFFFLQTTNLLIKIQSINWYFTLNPDPIIKIKIYIKKEK